MSRASGGATAADVLLSDGSVAVVRRLAATDGRAVHELHEQASDESIRFRFLVMARRTAHQYVDHVLASPDTIALVAEIDGRVVALGTAEPIGAHVSEIAFLVADAHRGQGLGTLLLEHLAASARDAGIRQFEARVFHANHRMLEVFEDAGWEVHRRLEGGDYALRMDIAVTAAVQAAADRREFAAEAASLAPLLHPRSVVLYGVRRDGTGVGAAVLSAVRDGGFGGFVGVVHPSADQVLGYPAFRSADALPTAPALAVIAVPALGAVAALEDAAAAGVGAAVVISSGFSELGDEGARLQLALARTARRRGVRVVGPNCLGLVLNDPAVRLNATFGGALPGTGGLAVASQSGGVGIALMDLIARSAIGLRSFVSLGNKADVSSNDLLATWYSDAEVTCAALYLESFGNARKFARFARTFSERKPIVAVVGGRSSGGRRAGASHTAAAASPAVGVRALFAQAGVIGCRDAEQLAETAQLLTREPLPAGRRVGIVSNAGGLGVLAADVAEDEGLEVVELSSHLQTRLAGLVHQTAGTSNPIDAGAGADAVRLATIASVVAGSREVDALVVVPAATASNDVVAALRELATVGAEHPGLPFLAIPAGAGDATSNERATVFGSAAAAFGALGRAVRYAEWRKTPPAPVEPSDPADVHDARLCGRALLAEAGVDGWIAPEAATSLLERYGIRLVGRFAQGRDAACRAAGELGYPVAVKVADAGVIHRTEHGLIRTGLGDADEIAATVAALERRMGRRATVLVQPMLTGVELALGVVRDPSIGPLVMVAAGGVATDVWDDRAFLVPPFGVTDVLRVMRTLRMWPLLEGFRGAEPVAVDRFAALAARLGRLAVDVPEVAELDLNPVLVGRDAVSVVDAKLRLAGAEVVLDLPRQLRRTY